MQQGEGASITTPSALAAMAEVQVTFIGDVVTTFLSQVVNTTNRTCTYVAQSISNG